MSAVNGLRLQVFIVSKIQGHKYFYLKGNCGNAHADYKQNTSVVFVLGTSENRYVVFFGILTL